MKKTEKVFGFIFLAIILAVGKMGLASEMLFFRLLIGMGLGYALVRGYGGFAGSVNRAYNAGSTKLMRALMLMFFISAVLTAAFVYSDPEAFSLWIRPLNLGLVFGGMLFGFGMSFSACCASGVFTDLTQGFPRAFITLIFFGMGVFVGWPYTGLSWVTDSWFSTASVENGVFFPDLFKWDGFNGYLGAIILTGLLALIVSGLSLLYEKKRKSENTFRELPIEIKEERIATLDSENFEVFSESTYNWLFVRPWRLREAVVAIALLFALLIGVTGSGWGVSGPFGIWFGKVFMLFGVSAESLANFTNQSAEMFATPLFENPISVQNFGITLGGAFYLLSAGKFKDTFLGGFNITPKLAGMYAVGGFAMGFGTRFSNGCNAGAFYTPIANFSLSGWMFLVVMVLGGIIGNTLEKKIQTE